MLKAKSIWRDARLGHWSAWLTLTAAAMALLVGCAAPRFPLLDLDELPSSADYPRDGEVVLLDETIATFDLVDGKPIVDISRQFRVRFLTSAGLLDGIYAGGHDVSFEPGSIDLIEFEGRLLAPYHARCAEDDAPRFCEKVDPGIGRHYVRHEAHQTGKLRKRVFTLGRELYIRPKHPQVGSVVEYYHSRRYHDAHLRGFNYRMGGRQPSVLERTVFDAPAGWRIQVVPRQRGRLLEGWEPQLLDEDGRQRQVWTLERRDPVPYERHAADLWALAPTLNFRLETYIDDEGVAHTPLPDRDAIGSFFAREIRERKLGEVTDDIREAAQRIVGDAASPTQKARRMHDWVRLQIRRAHVRANLDGMLPNRADDVLTKRAGREADIALLLVSMLEAVGVESHLVYIYRYSLVDREPDVPSILWSHDAVAVRVMLPDGPAWSFPGERTVPFGRIPGWVQNATAIRISDPGQDFEIGAEPPDRHTHTLDLDLRVTPDGEVTGRFTSRSIGLFADKARRRLAGAGARSRRLRLPGHLSIDGEVHRIDQIAGLGDDPGPEVRVGGELTLGERVEADGSGAWALRPSEFVSSRAPELPDVERFGPVLYGRPRTYRDRIALALPAGWTVDLPSEQRLDGAFTRFGIEYTFADGTLRIDRYLEVSATEIEVESYRPFQQEWATIRRLDRRPILIDRSVR